MQSGTDHEAIPTRRVALELAGLAARALFAGVVFSLTAVLLVLALASRAA